MELISTVYLSQSVQSSILSIQPVIKILKILILSFFHSEFLEYSVCFMLEPPYIGPITLLALENHTRGPPVAAHWAEM